MAFSNIGTSSRPTKRCDRVHGTIASPSTYFAFFKKVRQFHQFTGDQFERTLESTTKIVDD